MSQHVISHLDRSLLIMDCLAQLTCSGCEGMDLILSISFATDISNLARTQGRPQDLGGGGPRNFFSDL